MKKQEAREQMKRLREELSEQERLQRDQCIRERLLALEAMRQAECFFPFVSYGTEADTREIIAQVLREGRMRVAVPRVEGREMEFFEITSLAQLKRGYQGILEPTTDRALPATEGVMLLPGLAFDRRGSRVGYGGGFYDRYLARQGGNGLFIVALAYDFQVVERLETEEFDCRPDMVVTDKRLLRPAGI